MPPVFAVCLDVFDDLQTAILGSSGGIGLLAFAGLFGGYLAAAGTAATLVFLVFVDRA